MVESKETVKATVVFINDWKEPPRVQTEHYYGGVVRIKVYYIFSELASDINQNKDMTIDPILVYFMKNVWNQLNIVVDSITRDLNENMFKFENIAIADQEKIYTIWESIVNDDISDEEWLSEERKVTNEMVVCRPSVNSKTSIELAHFTQRIYEMATTFKKHPNFEIASEKNFKRIANYIHNKCPMEKFSPSEIEEIRLQLVAVLKHN